MRYQVQLLNGQQFSVEAQFFHPNGEGVVFYTRRNRPADVNDQWGNPLHRPEQVAIAFFNNVLSVRENPEEEEPFVGQVGTADVPFNMGNNWIVDDLGQMHNAQIAPVDPDGINWDAVQVDP